MNKLFGKILEYPNSCWQTLVCREQTMCYYQSGRDMIPQNKFCGNRLVNLVSTFKRGVAHVVALGRTSGTNFASLFVLAVNTTIAECTTDILTVITYLKKEWFVKARIT